MLNQVFFAILIACSTFHSRASSCRRYRPPLTTTTHHQLPACPPSSLVPALDRFSHPPPPLHVSSFLQCCFILQAIFPPVGHAASPLSHKAFLDTNALYHEKLACSRSLSFSLSHKGHAGTSSSLVRDCASTTTKASVWRRSCATHCYIAHCITVMPYRHSRPKTT